ncbi:GSCOCG00002439001-RA-CDS [Cotesia congregata]|uniref:Uncharacterized protein n=1 Tax=Cotesia congregata TaxID=51543 RepID=A0A8J2H789_COTCN|nr:GSCOCG00002439001-RA-CDS [Cotesia congregata]CAG5081039.1 Protein of unknown function [Cotesia congregata]
MKGFIAIFVVILASAYLQVEAGREMCPPENCIKAEQCEQPVRSTSVYCANGLPCCSVVKSKYRDRCRHHGGECMDSCAQTLQRKVVDCGSRQVCCVLVS